MAEDKAGFEIDGRFYPFPQSFRLGDPVLVKELTGMEFNDFVEAFDSLDPEDGVDPVVMVGLVGVAVWQEHPRWSRDKVVRFVQAVDMEKFDAIGGEGEASPPEQPAATPEPEASEPLSDPSSDASTTQPTHVAAVPS